MSDELHAAVLAGLDQTREAVFGGSPTEVWKFVPYKRLRDIAELTVELSEMLTTHEMLVLGSYMAASARTQLLAE